MAFTLAPAVFIVGARYAARALGISVVSYLGVDTVVSNAMAYIQSNLGSLGGDYAGLLGLFGIDTAISLIFSAYAIRIAMWASSRFIFGGS